MRGPKEGGGQGYGPPLKNKKNIGFLRPKENYALFPVTCQNFLGSVGRQTFLFIKNIFVWKKYEILRNSLKIDFNIPKGFKKV